MTGNQTYAQDDGAGLCPPVGSADRAVVVLAAPVVLVVGKAGEFTTGAAGDAPEARLDRAIDGRRVLFATQGGVLGGAVGGSDKAGTERFDLVQEFAGGRTMAHDLVFGKYGRCVHVGRIAGSGVLVK